MNTTNLFRLPVVDIDEEMEIVMKAYVATFETIKGIEVELDG